MIEMSRSSTKSRTRNPANWRPQGMWCIWPLTRSITVPLPSSLSWRSLRPPLKSIGSEEGLAFSLAAYTSAGVRQADGAMRSDLVVVADEPIELDLELALRLDVVLLVDELLEGLVKPFHLSAGLGMIGAQFFE